MKVEEAVRIARIMVRHGSAPDGEIASMLKEFPEVSWVEFFNDAAGFIRGSLHDKILDRLEAEALRRRRKKEVLR